MLYAHDFSIPLRLPLRLLLRHIPAYPTPVHLPRAPPIFYYWVRSESEAAFLCPAGLALKSRSSMREPGEGIKEGMKEWCDWSPSTCLNLRVEIPLHHPSIDHITSIISDTAPRFSLKD